jgi:hypothetical protein
MKNRIVKMKIKHKTVEFDMGQLREGGHIPSHYDADLLRRDQGLVSELIENNLGKVIHREKKAKKIED